MLKILIRNPACKRWISFTAAQLCQKGEPAIVSNSTHRQSVTLEKLIEDLPPPVHSKPFEELDLDHEAKEKHTDFGLYADHLAPPLPISFNLAAYVNQSESLKNLVRLGVDLSAIESKKPAAAKFILNLDFEKDVKAHLQFLHDHGVEADDLGKFITKNPFIFKECLEDMEIRINYLKSKRFDNASIARIMTVNPHFLSMKTLDVDSRLGFYQQQFSLTGNEVRYLITKAPRLLTHEMKKLTDNLIKLKTFGQKPGNSTFKPSLYSVRFANFPSLHSSAISFASMCKSFPAARYEVIFSIKEEMGFDSNERKKILLKTPKVYTMDRKILVNCFDVLHSIMKLPHSIIGSHSEAFQTRAFILKQRHLFLEHLGLAQYDSSQPLYVSLHDIAVLNDREFCAKCAKTSVENFNEFLRKL